MSDDEDDDGLPAFPWPMWIPAVSWIVHGLAIAASCIVMVVEEPASPYSGITYCFAAFIAPFAMIFFFAGISIARGRASLLRLAGVMSILVGGAIVVAIADFGGPIIWKLSVWHYGMDAIALSVAGYTALWFRSQLLVWIKAHGNQPSHPL
jgi:hypothetical protein